MELAAAAHLARYRQPFVVLEAGSEAVSSIREWAHVRTFSPWRYMVDSASRQLLPETGVCGTDSLAGASSCCGGPAPAEVDACWTDDATAKAAGKSGYLCNGEPVALLQVGRPK